MLPPSEIHADGGRALSHAERARFEASYLEHRATVMRVLRGRVGNAEDAADLMQEAYLRILRYRDCAATSLKPLLLRTALNLAASHRIRACSRMPHIPWDEVELVAQASSLDEDLDRDQRMQEVLTAVAALPDRCREIFLLRLLHGLRQREIAERCGISTRRVEQQLARAQALIRARVCASVACAT